MARRWAGGHRSPTCTGDVMASRALQLRWSWRDLRHRWVQVGAIALILAIGTGIFAALGSTAEWRRVSNDASFAAANMHDVKIRLSTGTTADRGRLAALVGSVPAAGAVVAAEERLVWPTQFEVPTGGGSELVGGEVVGSATDATVDRTLVRDGTAPTSGDTAVLEYKFGDARHLPISGELLAAGGQWIRYSGRGLSPEYFWLVADGASMLGEANRATVFVGLQRAQALTGVGDQVNDVVVDLRDPDLAATVRSQLESALTAAGLSGDVTVRAEDPAYRLLYEDIDNDQQIWNLISVLILAGASFAAFNLISRIVEAQRREIGIGMALGAPRRQLALRPVLVGAQVALVGVVGGVGVGVLFADAMRSMLDSVLPLPVWRTDFQPRRFLFAVGLGFVLPFAATAIPVWRAVRVEPIDAIRSGHGASAARGWAGLASRVRWPRRSLRQYPLRNLLRRPRRTALTALAVAAAITVLIGVFGMLDSFERTVDTADAELTYAAADRIDVQLDTFEPVSGATFQAIASRPEVRAVAPELTVPVELRRAGHDDIQAVVEIIDIDAAPWRPRVRRGSAPGPATGILLSEKAARDLHVGVGDAVVLHHPRRVGLGYAMVETTMRVAGTHRLPLRPYAFLDAEQAELFGLDGFANRAQVLPAAGIESDDAQRALFQLDGVGSAVAVGTAGDAWDESLAQYTGVLRMAQAATLLLALLIAFNSSSISVDERAREHATMFAFGVRRRTVIAMGVVESTIVGVLGTLAGIGGGYLVTSWIFGSLLPRAVPEVRIDPYLSPATGTALFALGVLVVGLAPILNVRRVRRMDIPATLRVVE